MWVSLKEEREGQENTNKQGCKMKIVSYIQAGDIYVQFLDEHGAIIHTSYDLFKKGKVRKAKPTWIRKSSKTPKIKERV